MDRIAEAAELALKNSDFGPEVKDHLQKVIDRNRELKAELAEANGLLDEVKKWKDQIHRVENDPIKAIEFVVDQFGVLDSILAKRKGAE